MPVHPPRSMLPVAGPGDVVPLRAILAHLGGKAKILVCGCQDELRPCRAADRASSSTTMMRLPLPRRSERIELERHPQAAQAVVRLDKGPANVAIPEACCWLSLCSMNRRWVWPGSVQRARRAAGQPWLSAAGPGRFRRMPSASRRGTISIWLEGSARGTKAGCRVPSA